MIIKYIVTSSKMKNNRMLFRFNASVFVENNGKIKMENDYIGPIHKMKYVILQEAKMNV